MRRNPLTTRKVQVLDAPDDANDIIEWLMGAMYLSEGYHYEQSLSRLMAINGWPEEMIGRGSFAIVLRGRQASGTVVKFTSDKLDGQTCAYLSELQLRVGSLPGVPKIYRVSRDGELYAILMERLVPLTSLYSHVSDFVIARFPDLDRRDRMQFAAIYEYAVRETRAAISHAFEVSLEDARNDAVNEARREGKLGPGTKEAILGQMEVFADDLRENMPMAPTDPADVAHTEMLENAAQAIESLIGLGVACPDLHEGNWGARLHADRSTQQIFIEFLVLDFGISSFPEGEELNMEVLEP